MTDNLFVQDPPKLTKNQYDDDEALKSLLSRLVPKELLSKMEPELKRLGKRVITDILELNNQAMDKHNEPVLIQYNGWGQRIDEIKVHDSWKKLHDISCEEGTISSAYTEESRGLYKEYARVLQFTKLYLFGPSSAMVTCPLSMTDGAARLIEQLKINNEKLHPLVEECYKHIITTNPKDFWTSGQWMTERTGGSDVSNTETYATEDEYGFKLYGYKFFTSATTANVSFALAKIQENGKVKEGSKGLSLFVLKLRQEDGKMNNIKVHRLKDKFGTKSLPTAELELVGTRAYLVGKKGEGVKTISHLFNITRIHTMLGSAAYMRRMIALMRDYAERRKVFGKKLSDQPLHLKTISDLEVTFRGTLHFFIDVVLLLGKSEISPNPKIDSLLRFLTPVGKLFTTKQAIVLLAEGMESFGGYGYMEDTGIPALYRDAMVNAIWEGTTNVLSHDVFRAISRDPNVIKLFSDIVLEKLSKNTISELETPVKLVKDGLKSITSFFKENKMNDQTESMARNFSNTVAKVYVGSLLIEHACWSKNEKDIYIASQWCTREQINYIILPSNYSLEKRIAMSKL